ncbi:MAG: Crp/Fnr family transcriptional regulator [Bdellovibrionota bacterium]
MQPQSHLSLRLPQPVRPVAPVPVPAGIPSRGLSSPVADFLRTVPLLKGTSDRLVQELSALLRPVRLERGGRICSEGTAPDAFYFVRQGWVKTLRATAMGRSVIFEILGPGDTVDATALLEESSHTVTAIAGSPVELLVMPASAFRHLLARHADLWRGCAIEMSYRLREAVDSQTQIAFGVEARIARLFLRLAARSGAQDGQEVCIPRFLTRQEIADMVGTTMETTIRTLSRWKRQGLFKTGDESFVIRKMSDFAGIAREDAQRWNSERTPSAAKGAKIAAAVAARGRPLAFRTAAA